MTAGRPHLSIEQPPSGATARSDSHPAGQLLTITTRPAPPAATVLTVRGEVDALTSTRLTDHLLPHLRDTVTHVIVDLTGVSFFGAAGLTVLVNARQAAVAAGVTLCVVAATRPVLRPLTMTGLDDMFDISPDVTHALWRAGSEAKAT